MKIITKSKNNKVCWDDIEIGEAYLGFSGIDIYIKIPEVYDKFERNMNSIRLKDGCLSKGGMDVGKAYIIYKDAEVHLNDNK